MNNDFKNIDSKLHYGNGISYFYFPLFFSMAITFFPAKPLIFEQALNKVWSRFSWITRYKTVIRLS